MSSQSDIVPMQLPYVTGYFLNVFCWYYSKVAYIIECMAIIKHFFSILHQNSLPDSQRGQRFKLVLGSEILIVLYIFVITIMDFITGNKGYNYFSLGLLVFYVTSLILYIFLKNKAFPSLFFCITFGINCLISFYIKGNSGIGTIWLLLMPTLTMYVVGLSYGFYSTVVVFICYVALLIIPFTREQLLSRYSTIFLWRYTLLFIIDSALCTAAMYSFHHYRVKQNQNQKDMENAVIEEHNKVVSISMQTIIAISNAVEAKDIHIGKHSQRVAHFSCLLARKIGWSEKEIRRLHTIAMLHDIGKIGVDSSILNKETNLNDDEYEKLKDHTRIGGKILKDLTIIPRVNLGANYHHEFFNGKGYPDGLSGLDIPIEARIVCIADSFDSMRYPRIYKQKMTLEEIKMEFLRGKGSQFDPELTDAFLKLCEENDWFLDYEVN